MMVRDPCRIRGALIGWYNQYQCMYKPKCHPLTKSDELPAKIVTPMSLQGNRTGNGAYLIVKMLRYMHEHLIYLYATYCGLPSPDQGS